MTGERERAREAARLVLDELIRNNPVRELLEELIAAGWRSGYSAGLEDGRQKVEVKFVDPPKDKATD